MTPSEKAKELVGKFTGIESGWSDNVVTDDIQAKQCALIAVDEIIKSNPTNPLKGDGYIELYSDMIDESVKYWQQVKQEINKL